MEQYRYDDLPAVVGEAQEPRSGIIAKPLRGCGWALEGDDPF